MSSTATLEGGSWLIGESSQPKTSSSGRVLFCEFNTPRPLPLPKTVDLNSLIGELESDPAMAAEMSAARRDLAQTLYGNEPTTLSSLRLGAGLSQAGLAAIVGTSQSHIARIERGTTDPGTDIIARMADALGVQEEVVFRAVRQQLSARA